MSRSPSSPNSGLAEFGARLRKVRKDRYLSLVQVADKVGCSKAALSRYERGEVLIPTAIVERLDDLYRSGGELVGERNALSDGSWLPRGAFRTQWDHNHPAGYSGPVWIRVVPDPAVTPARYRLAVRWGEWRLCHEEVLDANGAYFVHTKPDDGLSLPLEVTTSPASHVVYGRGFPPADHVVIDINHGWSHWLAYDILGRLRRVAPTLTTRIERQLHRAPLPHRRA